MPHAYPNQRKNGFALIELAIVLVVIGLVVGGVIVGKEMINTANIRKTAKMLTDLDMALEGFRLKYGCDAGDCIASTMGIAPIGGSASTNIDGNGDGIVSVTYEWNQKTLPQLNAAGFIGYGSSMPVRIPLGRKTRLDLEAYLPPGANAYPYYAATLCALFLAPPFQSLTPNDVLRLDTMLDDGKPQSGRILGAGHFGIYIGYTNPAGFGLSGLNAAGPLNDGVSCLTNTTPAAYNNLGSNEPLCSLVYTFGTSK